MRDCIVYLAHLVKIESGIFDAYIDFRLDRDLYYFVSSSPQNQDFGKTKTYIELRSLKTTRRLSTGCYYKLNLDLLNRCDFTENEESLVIGRSYDLESIEFLDYNDQDLLQSHEALDRNDLMHNHENGRLQIPDFFKGDLFLLVRDVGLANWNELLDENNIIRIVYDIGAKLLANQVIVRKLFNSRLNALKRAKPILVISHWDIDHYHCLECASIQEIRACFSKVVCMDMMKSLTSQRIYEKILYALGSNNVFCIKPAFRIDGIQMHLWQRIGNIAFYIGEYSRTINYAGLCMFVRGNTKSAIFTGDVKLMQAKNIYDNERTNGLRTYKHVLIAPHHGGDYGINSRLYSCPTTSVIISVGPNSYGHPSPNMLSYLMSLCHGNVYRTDYSGDIIDRI